MPKLAAETIRQLVTNFEQFYLTVQAESSLDSARRAFHSFWTTKILDKNVTTLNEVDDLDPIIRIIDTAAKRIYPYESSHEHDSLLQRLVRSGRQFGLDYNIVDDSKNHRLVIERSFNVARCMLTQTDWHTIFKTLKQQPTLSSKLDQIFKETNPIRRASLTDELKQLNSGNRNLLTSPQAVALNAFLFCNNPSEYVSVISLSHRRMIIETFELGEYKDSWSYGEQVVFSNNVLKSFNEKYNVVLSPRKLSWFFYWEQVQPIWKVEKEKAPQKRAKLISVQQAPLILGKEMLNFHELEEPEKKELGEIVKLAEEGSVAIPHFQREFVWARQDISQLLESILRGYYVGSLLFWSVKGDPDLKIEPVYGTGLDEKSLKPHYLILDGQQRISSIFYATRAPNQPLWNTKRAYLFFIDLRKLLEFEASNESSDLVISMSREDADKLGLLKWPGQFQRWLFPIFEFANFHEWIDEFEEHLKSRIEVEQDKIPEIKKRLRQYLRTVWEKFEIPIIKLPEQMELVDVAKIFEKLNSTGVVLTVFDLLNARMVKHHIRLRELWENARETHPLLNRFSEGNERFPVYVLQTVALLRDKPSKSEELLKLSPENFNTDWSRGCEALENALTKMTNLREDGYGVLSSKWLPYVTMVPVLANLLEQLEKRRDRPKCIEKINSWYWSAIVTHAYSGSTDTQIALDSRQVLEWFNDDDRIPDTVRQAREEMKTINLSQANRMSDAIYKGIMCLTALKGGRDFLKFDMIEFSDLDDHHIFPKSRAEEFKAGSKVNSVANKTLIDKETNEKYIRNSRPSHYLTKIMKEQGISAEDLEKRLGTHMISYEAFKALMSDDFSTFVSLREETIKKELSSLIFRPFT